MDKEVIDGHVKALMGSLDTGKCKQLVMENDEEKCDWMFGQDYLMAIGCVLAILIIIAILPSVLCQRKG